MIEINSITKKYGKVLANDQISLSVKRGELAVLLGPNGAGKSTLIKCICGLLRFDGGISIGGNDNHSVAAKKMLGYVPEIPALYPMLTVYEHLEFVAKAYRLNDWESRARELLVRFDLEDKRNKLGKELSKGMQQKVSVCCAVLPEPAAIIFDEPLVGLDPHGIRQLKAMLNSFKEDGRAVIVSTHMIESMEDNWDVTYIMNNGRIMYTCRRSDMSEGGSLENIYFSIIEGENTLLNKEGRNNK